MFCADLDAFILPCVHIPNLNTRWKWVDTVVP